MMKLSRKLAQILMVERRVHAAACARFASSSHVSNFQCWILVKLASLQDSCINHFSKPAIFALTLQGPHQLWASEICEGAAGWASTAPAGCITRATSAAISASTVLSLTVCIASASRSFATCGPAAP
ncbi:hypothetical protein GOP47_0002204 [Adiantum capillus-veneris]|uniref:Uncharacterized protein n=1 Tax=Adiantum capillus-veneris TaxID=13818 RepID=A0A9D4VB50_ADICA|nr:hypothetical protein GOP47_0002204 [Adiantum capillus-veneris]